MRRDRNRDTTSGKAARKASMSASVVDQPADPDLYRRAWLALAQLAEAREDHAQAADAWKRAAQIDNTP